MKLISKNKKKAVNIWPKKKNRKSYDWIKNIKNKIKKGLVLLNRKKKTMNGTTSWNQSRLKKKKKSGKKLKADAIRRRKTTQKVTKLKKKRNKIKEEIKKYY